MDHRCPVESCCSDRSGLVAMLWRRFHTVKNLPIPFRDISVVDCPEELPARDDPFDVAVGADETVGHRLDIQSIADAMDSRDSRAYIAFLAFAIWLDGFETRPKQIHQFYPDEKKRCKKMLKKYINFIQTRRKGAKK